MVLCINIFEDREMDKVPELSGRILLGHIFLLAGINKIPAYEATAGYMEAMAVPGILLPLVILLEILGGLALITGFRTRVGRDSAGWIHHCGSDTVSCRLQ
jgi:uncharacterized membrane protein YphA (DoxX/SURF4 family)